MMAPVKLAQVVAPYIRILAAKPTVFTAYCRGISQSLLGTCASCRIISN